MDSSISKTKASSSSQISSSKYRYQQEIQAMMFTFGDARNPLPACTQLIEDIVHSQMIEIIQRAIKIAARRGSRFLSIDDFIFLVRHDSFKVKRLKEFLSWKDIRKNVRNNSGENNDEILLGSGAGAADEEEKLPNSSESSSPQSSSKSSGSSSSEAIKRRKIILSWDYLDSFREEGGSASSSDSEDSDLEEEDFSNEAKGRLRIADMMTLQMSKEEYMEYSECRQASFTFKKAKKFREWLSLGKFVEVRPNDDVIEILGFLAWEIVRIITETAVCVKEKFERTKMLFNSSHSLQGGSDKNISNQQPLTLNDLFSGRNAEWKQNPAELLQKFVESSSVFNEEIGGGLNSSQTCSSSSPSSNHRLSSLNLRSQTSFSCSRSIFARPAQRTPIQLEYIYEACRRLERPSNYIPNFAAGKVSRIFAPIC